MRAHIIENGIVSNTIEVETLDFLPNLVEATEGGIGWSYVDGKLLPPPELIKTPEQIKKEITDATSERLNSFAQTRNYDSILSACTYATSSVLQFAKEGQYCVNMRDATWGKLYQIMQEVEAGTRVMPAEYGDIEAELPVLGWPV
ncbi:MAG: hypothetical protein M1572_02545 [Gammaproteobacteria bacterium]|nr:hypothetical protein [Gammaproteobacteria bacterium]